MRNGPSDHLEGQPQRVDAEGDDEKEPPLDVGAEELGAVTVKGQLLTVDGGVLDDPVNVEAESPGSAKAEGKGDKSCAKDADADEAEKAAVKLRFHSFLQKIRMVRDRGRAHRKSTLHNALC